MYSPGATAVCGGSSRRKTAARMAKFMSAPVCGLLLMNPFSSALQFEVQQSRLGSEVVACSPQAVSSVSRFSHWQCPVAGTQRARNNSVSTVFNRRTTSSIAHACWYWQADLSPCILMRSVLRRSHLTYIGPNRRREVMSVWLWVGVLLAAVWAAHWGAERIAKPLKKLRKRWGLTEVAGAAFVGLAAASPEIGINVASAATSVPDIGLGAMLGSNILAIPLVVSVAYWASRKRELGSHEGHEEHRKQKLLAISKQAVTVQALPYLAIVILMAVLTLPKQWRGLQPVDGWIMLGAYVLYLAQALLRGRSSGEKENWSKKEVALAAGGVGAVVLGAYFTVKSTEQIVSYFGISKSSGACSSRLRWRHCPKSSPSGA